MPRNWACACAVGWAMTAGAAAGALLQNRAPSAAAITRRSSDIRRSFVLDEYRSIRACRCRCMSALARAAHNNICNFAHVATRAKARRWLCRRALRWPGLAS
ncbi:hypothetical protein G6F54_013780 [Rhizopus delemar]|nr:hypothetical protein G6F54_013780 [Rhizopus delemar]